MLMLCLLLFQFILGLIKDVYKIIGLLQISRYQYPGEIMKEILGLAKTNRLR